MHLLITKKKSLKSEVKHIQLLSTPILNMAPIYDNGSSMGREINEERVQELISDDAQLHKYIDKGLK